MAKGRIMKKANHILRGLDMKNYYFLLFLNELNAFMFRPTRITRESKSKY